MTDGDASWMRRAIELGRRGLGQTAPNPAVGAVIVRGGKLLGEGWHQRVGSPHAEINAIHDALGKGLDPKGGDVYVTLEPCSTYGRTPPCTNALILIRPRRVVIGVIDPNPKHQGRGVDALRAAGIEVEVGLLESECARLLEDVG